MSPDDDHGTSAVETSTGPIVRIPEAETSPAPPSPATPSSRTARAPIFTRSRAAWLAAVTVFLLGAFALVLIALAPTEAPAPTSRPITPAANGGGAGAALALPAPAEARTGTVNAGGDNDLLAASLSGLGSVARFEGAPVTADGVTVGTVYSDTVFSVTSPSGGELVVLEPYTVAGAPALAASDVVVFNGTLMPGLDDLSEFIGPEAAAVVARTGSYIVAVPESIHVITPSETPVD